MSYYRFTKNIGLVAITNSLNALRGIIILPIITKLLGAANYGIWAQLGVTLSLITPFTLLGLSGAVIRFLAAEKEKKEIQEGAYSVLTLVFLTGIITALALIIFSEPVGNFFQAPPVFIKILSLIILFECLISVLMSLLQAFQEIGKYSFFSILKTFGEVGLVIGAVLLGYQLQGAVISLLVIRILIFLMLFGLIFKKIGIKIPNFSKIREYLSFSLPRVLSSASYWMVTSSDRYLIGFFLGVLFVGYYTPAYSIGDTINFFLYPLFTILPVVLSKSFDENKINEVKNYLKYSLKYFLMIAIPAVFGLSVLSRQLLIIFSTPEIASNSYYVTPFIALSILFYGIASLNNQILMLVKKTKITGNIWLAAALLNLGLNFIFIPRFGILGAAFTTLLAYLFALVLTFYFSSKELTFEIDWKFIIKSIFSSTLMVLFIIWFEPIGLPNVLIAILAGAVLYGILIFFLKGIREKEIEFLKGFLRKQGKI